MSAVSNSSQPWVTSLTKQQFENIVDAKLRRFADNLKSSQGYHNKGIRFCENVRKLLEQAVRVRTPHFSIASTHPGGSMAKSTDLENSDFDIVMKINNGYPPFNDVLHFFERTLTEFWDELDIIEDSIETTRYSLQFTFDNGMKVDLLPASAHLTFEQILEQMRLDPRNKRYYGSGLVEKQVEFMKKQSAFSKALARLAKHWYKSMDCPYYVGGGSMIFELLGVVASLEQRDSGRESMSLGFSRIVEMVENLDEIGIELKRTRRGWRIKRDSGLERPYILEPTNRTNDLMDGIDEERGKFFVRHGEEMSERLWNLMEKRQYCRKGDGEHGFEISFGKLFKPFDYWESDGESDTESESYTEYDTESESE